MKTLPMTNIQVSGLQINKTFEQDEQRSFSTFIESIAGFQTLTITYIPGTDPILRSVHASESGTITAAIWHNPEMLKEVIKTIEQYEELLAESMREVYTDDYFDEIIPEDYS